MDVGNDVYVCVRKMLDICGINFKNIPKKDILATCKSFNSKISKDIYDIILKSINDHYEEMV